MRFSVWPAPGRPVSEIIDRATMADTSGWYGVWFADHYMPNTGDHTVADGDSHEAWAILPAIAAVTERVRVGPLVSPTSVHHPAVLANRAASIDHVSGGRFVLGIGAGWQINEHGAYGIELQEPGPRVDRFEEAIQVVRSLLDEPRTTFAGDYYTITDAPCDPKPVQERLPLLVGTGSPRMLRITARHADEWNTWGTPETVAERTAAFERACEAVGRDPIDLWRSAQALIFLTDDPERAATLRDRAPAERSLIGSTEQVIDMIGGYVDLGVDEFIIPDFSFSSDADERSATYQRITEEIVPAFT